MSCDYIVTNRQSSTGFVVVQRHLSFKKGEEFIPRLVGISMIYVGCDSISYLHRYSAVQIEVHSTVLSESV